MNNVVFMFFMFFVGMNVIYITMVDLLFLEVIEKMRMYFDRFEANIKFSKWMILMMT